MEHPRRLLKPAEFPEATIQKTSLSFPSPLLPVPFSYIGKPLFLLPVTAEEAEVLRAGQGRARLRTIESFSKLGRKRKDSSSQTLERCSTQRVAAGTRGGSGARGTGNGHSCISQGMATPAFYPTEA